MTRPIFLFAILLLALLAFAVFKRQRGAEPAPAPPGVEPAGLQSKPIHSLRERNTTGANEYLVQNLLPGPIEVRCALASAQNVRSEPVLPRRLVLPARAERVVAELKIVDPGLPARASMSCAAMIGDPGARPPEARAYVLPLPAGIAYTIDQGFGGRFSHDNEENRYALDLGVPEGTPVLAARAGIVIQVEEDFRASGTDAAIYGDRANYVRVLHDDGSMALYAHLAPASMLRRPGDRVVEGQLVGKSGNTGFSTGPHLHFSVQRNAGMALRAIPFTMAGVDPHGPRD